MNGTSGVLTFIPPGGELSGGEEVVVSVLSSVLLLNGASHVTLANLSVGEAQEDALRITEAKEVRIEGCTVARAGGKCLYLEGTNSSVSNSTVRTCGTAGISIVGGDFATLDRGELRVDGNDISDFARWERTYEPVRASTDRSGSCLTCPRSPRPCPG